MDQNFCLFWNDRIGEERKKEKNFSLFLSFSMLHFFFTQTTLFVISSNFCQNFRIEMQNRTWGEEEEVELNFFLSSFVFLSKFSLSLKFSEEVAFIISKIRTSKKESINCAWDWTKGLLIRNSHLYLFVHIRSFVRRIHRWWLRFDTFLLSSSSTVLLCKTKSVICFSALLFFNLLFFHSARISDEVWLFYFLFSLLLLLLLLLL